MLKGYTDRIHFFFKEQTNIAPLAVLRIAFGAIMFISILRFILKGWVTDFYVTPQFFFTYYGFEWVRPLGETGMFALFYLMAVAALCVLFGFFYRAASVIFFLCFTYVELIDKTNYLNHYYFISIVSFLMILVPAHRYFSLDVWRKPMLKATTVPVWTISIFKLQLLIIYFFAGISKINYDWMVEAMPLKLWLPANAHVPVVGLLLTEEWVAYLFSWFGLVFDLFIGFVLWNKRTVKTGYFFVVVFHLFTAYFFKIGMFPYIMIGMTLVFLPENFHIKFIKSICLIFRLPAADEEARPLGITPVKMKVIKTVLIIYFVLQILIPFRYLCYPGRLFWTEEGYRFSWRVMLMDKAGTSFFYVKEAGSSGTNEIVNAQFLTRQQEYMMSTQPDMILQYAHYLADVYKKRGFRNPVVTVESYVTLNGSGSRLFIDSKKDLSKEKESFLPKTWILPFVDNKAKK